MPLVPREHNPSILAHRLGPPGLRSLGKIIQLFCLSTFSTDILPPPLWSILPHAKHLFPFESCFVKLFTKNRIFGVDRVFFEEGQSRKVQNLKRRSSAASLLIARVFLFPFNFPHLSIFLSGLIQITLSHFHHFPTSILKFGWSLDIPSHPMKAKYEQVHKDTIVLIMWQHPYWSPIVWVLAQRKKSSPGNHVTWLPWNRLHSV